MKKPRKHFIPSVKIHSSDLVCIWKLTFGSKPIDRTWKGSHLVKGELRICKGCSDWSFPLPLRLLLQLLDLPHQSLLLGQELHKLFPGSTVFLKCVANGWKYGRPVFLKEGVKHCVIELAVLTEKDPLFVFYPDLPVSLVKHFSSIMVRLSAVLIIVIVTWIMIVGLPGNLLKPSRPPSAAVSTFNLREGSTLTHARFNCDHCRSRTFRHLDILQYGLNRVNWVNGAYQVKHRDACLWQHGWILEKLWTAFDPPPSFQETML